MLTHIMDTGAGADDKGLLAPPCFAVSVLAGMQNGAAEVAQRRNIRKVRNAAHSGGHDDVPRVHLPLRALTPPQRNGPPLLLFVVPAALEFGAGPIVELHAFRVSLEPGGKLVLGNVARPGRR